VLTPAELAELDNLADLRVSATQGEGFGVLTIEAMACGTPTLITDYTTSRELLLGIPDCRLPISDFAQRPPAGVARATPQRRFAPSSVILPVPEHDGNQAVAHLPPAVRVESNPADPQARAPVLHPLRAIGNRKSEIGDTLDPFGPAGELVRVASWTVEQRRHLLRPIIDTADLAARIVALRDSPDRLARYAEAGLRRVHAAYTVEHMARAWLDLVHSILG
jgi:glycosyltransferase involved in cell wall biosynthesis